MFGFIRGYFSFDLLVELRERLISVKVFTENRKFEDAPYIAIEAVGGKTIIRDIGIKAKDLTGPNIKVINPFSHPRTLVSNFTYAEKIIQHAIQSLHGFKLGLRPSPRIVMHQLEKIEGGLTDIEERVLRELAAGAGAREVLIHTGEIINTSLETYEKIKTRTSAA